MENSIEITIHAEPTSERKRSYNAGSFTVRTDTSDRKRYKDTLAVQILDALDGSGIKAQMPIEGPIGIAIQFHRPKPKSYPQNPTKRYPWPEEWITKPDVDNLAKPVMDVLSDIGFWGDDAQVVNQAVRKEQGSQHKIIIRIWWKEQDTQGV